jgi:dTDP-4-dehydrorhamnose reductase
VINCVGIVKSLTEVVSVNELYYVNSFFPHILSKITNDKNISLIHFSTDCVFSGKDGNYKEHDTADAKGVYGRSKFYGEVTRENTLVLRISLIGREIKTNRGLIEWFLRQNEVDGFVNAIFSGMPSVSIGRFLRHYLTQCAKKSGLYHLSADPISKYELLKLVNFRLSKNIKIKPTELPNIDRSLNSAKLRDEFGWYPSSWKQLVDEMCEWQYDKQ